MKWSRRYSNLNVQLIQHLSAFILGFIIDHSSFNLQFLSSNFTVMLFHYDGVVDEWKDYKWNDNVIHVSAKNQTKWRVALVLNPIIFFECSFKT